MRLEGPNWGLRVGISLPLLLNQTRVPSPTGCSARLLMPRCDEGKYLIIGGEQGEQAAQAQKTQTR